MKVWLLSFLLVAVSFADQDTPKLGLKTENKDYRIETRFTFPDGMVEKYRTWEEDGDCDTNWQPRVKEQYYYEGSTVEISVFKKGATEPVVKRSFPVDITSERVLMTGEYILPITDGQRTGLVVYFGANFQLDAQIRKEKIFSVGLTDLRKYKFAEEWVAKRKVITSYTTTNDPRSKYKDEVSALEYLEY